MLRITVPKQEYFDDGTNEFTEVEGFELELEHSLVSVSKWESIYKKPFLAAGTKTEDEIYAYIEAMILDSNAPEGIARKIPSQQLAEINDYIESSRSATTFREEKSRRKVGEVITSEMVYYWMVAFNIPFECESWHLNRLFALIRICNIKQGKPKKMSKSEMLTERNRINEERKARLGTRG